MPSYFTIYSNIWAEVVNRTPSECQVRVHNHRRLLGQLRVPTDLIDEFLDRVIRTDDFLGETTRDGTLRLAYRLPFNLPADTIISDREGGILTPAEFSRVVAEYTDAGLLNQGSRRYLQPPHIPINPAEPSDISEEAILPEMPEVATAVEHPQQPDGGREERIYFDAGVYDGRANAFSAPTTAPNNVPTVSITRGFIEGEEVRLENEPNTE